MESRKVGRAINNDFVIDSERSVSGQHCLIEQVAEHTFLLTDLDSTNGTTVNGRKVKRKVVSQKDEVLLGRFELSLEEVFASKSLDERIAEQPPEPVFEDLKQVWEDYEKGKMMILQKVNAKKTWTRAAFSLIPFVGSAIGLALTAKITPHELLTVLKNEFMYAYTCPNCSHFLGEIPFQSIEKQGKCRSCRKPWY